MFVSESFLIGSAKDNKAIIIEKTPEKLDVYDPGKKYIVCANHFQGSDLLNTKSNQDQIRESASDYRYKRVMQLIDTNGTNTVAKTVALLRDQRGLDNTDIGMGNEKAINQLIAHHSIVFEPKKLKVWISSAPWQLGAYVAYDLNKVFALRGMKQNQEICDSVENVPADTFLRTKAYENFVLYRRLKQRAADGAPIDLDSLVKSNPLYYHTYVIAGDYLFKRKKYQDAIPYYKMALDRVIATKPEEQAIRAKIKTCEQKSGA